MKVLKSDEIFEQVKRITSEAKSSVRIVSAWLKGTLIESLLKDLPSNVKLEVILRASELRDLFITDENVFKKIKERQGNIYLNNRLHAKFIIVDNEKAVLGSANFTEAGFSDYSKGNIEAAVYYDIKDDENEISNLVNYFEKIKEDSRTFDDDLIGFAINPVKSKSFEFVLVEPEINEESYVEVKTPEGIVLAKVESIYSYDMGFFANPFSSKESGLFASFDTFKTLFSARRDKNWKKAAVWSYLNENGDKVKIAVAKILGIVKDEKLETLLKPFDVGEPVYRASISSLGRLLNKNFSGNSMLYPVYIGKLKNSDLEIFIDLKEVINKHMLVLGTTGAGKSHFIKLFLSRVVNNFRNEISQVYIFDPHGEYYQALKDFGIPKDDIYHLKLKDTIFPIYPEEVEDFVKSLGYYPLVSGNSSVAKKNKSIIAKSIKPNLMTTSFKDSNLEKLLDSLDTDTFGKGVLVDEAETIYGKELITNQKEIYEELLKSINTNQKVIIFDFSQITSPRTRVNLAGLIMQELFKQNKLDKKERLIVLEEAHNFAPESSYGDVSAGKDNLALTMARKIASEGRKFNLGLIVITQRPAQVSKYVLSQANTQVMFRTINASDIETISCYVEQAGKEILELLPVLQTGVGIVSGLAVPFPLLVHVM